MRSSVVGSGTTSWREALSSKSPDSVLLTLPPWFRIVWTSAGDSFANCVVKTPIQGELPALSRATPLAAIDKLVPVGVASNLYGEFADGEHAGALASRTL